MPLLFVCEARQSMVDEQNPYTSITQPFLRYLTLKTKSWRNDVTLIKTLTSLKHNL